MGLKMRLRNGACAAGLAIAIAIPASIGFAVTANADEAPEATTTESSEVVVTETPAEEAAPETEEVTSEPVVEEETTELEVTDEVPAEEEVAEPDASAKFSTLATGFDPYFSDVDWLTAYTGSTTPPVNGDALYPQTLYTERECGTGWIQSDHYYIENVDEHNLLFALTTVGVLNKGGDSAIYVSHTFTQQTPCEEPPTPTYPTQDLNCEVLTVNYGHALQNGDHINMTINGSQPVNAYVDQNVAGGYNTLGLRINGHDPIPLTQEQVESGIIVYPYASFLNTDDFTVEFVQTNSLDTWPDLECGETPPVVVNPIYSYQEQCQEDGSKLVTVTVDNRLGTNSAPSHLSVGVQEVASHTVPAGELYSFEPISIAKNQGGGSVVVALSSGDPVVASWTIDTTDCETPEPPADIPVTPVFPSTYCPADPTEVAVPTAILIPGIDNFKSPNVWNVAGPGVQAIQFDKTNVEFTVVDGSSLLTVFADSTDVVDNGDGTYTATFVNVVNPGFYFPAGDGYTVSDDGTITSVRTFNILCPTKVVPPTNPPTDTPKTPALASTNGVEGSEIAGGIGLGILLLGVGAALVIRRRKAATDHS